MHLHYAIVFVKDMKRSVAFYRDAVGLSLRFESSHWSEFETGEASLALHLSESASPPRDPKADPPGSCRPGLRVDDLDAFHHRMVTAGVPCLQEPKETFGARIAQYADPDGLSFSVSERMGGGAGDGA